MLSGAEAGRFTRSLTQQKLRRSLEMQRPFHRTNISAEKMPTWVDSLCCDALLQQCMVLSVVYCSSDESWLVELALMQSSTVHSS